MNKNEINHNEIHKAISSLLDTYSDILDTDTYSEVMHYLQHGEYEMAFEGLFIDLINASFDVQKVDIEYYFNLGEKLNLNKESIFNHEFWNVFKNYIEK
jgi:hypothetical protein